MGIGISISGFKELERTLRTMSDATNDEVLSSLFTEAELIMSDIKSGGWVPKDTGALETSGRVLPPQMEGATATVTLGFGGAAIPYALIQHEAQHFKHPGQGQAKYLEAPLRLWAPRIMRPIADRIRRRWEKAVR